MIPLNNNYIVLPDENVGESVEAVGDNRWFLPMKGTVVAVPERINTDWEYLSWARKRYKKNYPEKVLNKMRHIVRTTTEVKPTTEIKIGDRVMFSYIAHRNHNEEGLGENMLVHSDELICKIDPVEPLNGYLLVQMDEIPEMVVKKDMNAYGTATVIHASPCTSYRDGGIDDERIKVGDRVAFTKNSCVRLEANEFNTLNPGGFSSLFRVRRKDVLVFSNETVGN